LSLRDGLAEVSRLVSSWACEHAFVISDGSPLTRFRRAIDARSLFLAETAARELNVVSLGDARALLDLYAEAASNKYDRAAVRWLARYALETEPGLHEFVVATLDLKRQAP
jgi:hypothetical protein